MAKRKNSKHPALALFEQMFKEATASGKLVPTHVVGRQVFQAKCREAGIPCPAGFIELCRWEEEIGLRKLAKKLISKHRRQINRTPMEKGARDLERHLKRTELS